MDTNNRSREEPSRRPRQSGSAKQPPAQGQKRRPQQEPQSEAKRSPRPQEEPQAEAKRRTRPQEAPQAEAKRRPGPEPQTARKPRPDAGGQQRRRENPQRQTEAAKQVGETSRRQKSKEASGQQKQTPRKTEKATNQTQTRRTSRKRETPDDLSSKKRAYGNSKPKKKSAFAILRQAVSATAKENAAKRNARLERQGKRSKRDSQQPLPAVIYTQPQAFNRDRLLVQLVTVTAVVVAFVVGLSVFFKVRHIRVSGAEVYTAWAVSEASGIKEGDNLLTFSRARAGAQIKANLPYVNNVSFGIRLPDTVNIIIEEENVVYAIKDQDEQWWLINSSGRVVEQAQKGQASNYTQILGVALEHPLKDQEAVAVEAQAVAQTPDPDPTGETTEPVVVVPTVSGAQRLSIALQIVQALEDNDIVGDAASINVSQPQSITMWYGTRYQINLGDSGNLEYKIACMNSVILSMQEYDSGILDCSFTVWPDQVSYTPFS